MTDFGNIKLIGNNITNDLIKIRETIGAPTAPYNPQPPEPVVVVPGKKLAEWAQLNKRKPIIINNEFCFAYIKDNTYQGSKLDSEVKAHPNKVFSSGNKVHFYYCETLTNMTKNNRKRRYRATTISANERKIDTRDLKDKLTRLPLCKHCINILSYNGAIRRQTRDINSYIAEYGDATELMECVKTYDKNNDFSAEEKIKAFFHKNNSGDKTWQPPLVVHSHTD